MGSGSESATVAEMVYHVAMTDKAFRATDFNQDGGPGDDIGFVIAAVTVFKDAESEGNNLKGRFLLRCKFLASQIHFAILQGKCSFVTSLKHNLLDLGC